MLSGVTVNCANCKQGFSIETEDFDFYKRINVPPPTHCPDCRSQRRLAWFNLFNLYKRTCDLCKQEYISMYHPKAPYKTYCTKCWWSDDWDPLAYGREYDFSKPFFEQFDALLRDVPLLGLSYDYPKNINSPYINNCGPMKNSSLVFNASDCEEVLVGYYLHAMKSSLDSSLGMESERIYDSRNFFKANSCIGIENTTESIDCMFLRDSRNCQNCFASANLISKKYHIFNQPYSKEEYFEKIKQWNLGSYAGYQALKKEAHEHWKRFPPKPVFLDLSVDCAGNYTFESKNCTECYEVQNTEDSKYCSMFLQGPNKNNYDISGWGNNLELSYEGCVIGEFASRLLFCQEAGLNSMNCEYSKLFINSSNLFGCVSLRKKQYCILNKQYTKLFYDKIITQIKKDMTARGEYGEFFPMSISPHQYYETFAQDFFPHEETKPKEKQTYAITMRASELPDHIADATPLVLKNIIECEKCQRGYRIAQMEFDFLKQMRLPLPRRCPFCRIDEKFKAWVLQMKLVDRTCDQCKKDFRTPYTSDEYPAILCKECWTEKYS